MAFWYTRPSDNPHIPFVRLLLDAADDMQRAELLSKSSKKGTFVGGVSMDVVFALPTFPFLAAARYPDYLL
ncbi:hypothetical protein E4T56_gene18316 [Termitomyces sp. T112]|nr:hypothetical protein E4T56_gene18316 [Termitomyces sp. T112]